MLSTRPAAWFVKEGVGHITVMDLSRGCMADPDLGGTAPESSPERSRPDAGADSGCSVGERVDCSSQDEDAGAGPNFSRPMPPVAEEEEAGEDNALAGAGGSPSPGVDEGMQQQSALPKVGIENNRLARVEWGADTEAVHQRQKYQRYRHSSLHLFHLGATFQSTIYYQVAVQSFLLFCHI